MFSRPLGRSFLSLLIAWVLACPISVRAQEAAEVENSKYQIVGSINANAVYVRSGPSENDYPTMQLNKGAEVTVVGDRFNWLKIVPPDGSFCFVSKAYVNRAGDGTIGQSTGTPYVRVGSSLNPLKTKTAMTLEPGQRLEIIGEQDEYFRVKPPAGVFLYVNKQFVDPVKQLPAGGGAQPVTAEIKLTQTPQPGQSTNVQGDQPSNNNENAAIPSTQPVAVAENNATPATQPSADAQAEFERLENLYSQSSQRPLDEQPITEMLSGYEKLATGDALPESMRRIAEFKASTLKGRAKMQEDFIGMKKIQEDSKSKQVALKAEQKEIQDRIENSAIQFYTAVGTLRTSSLQLGQPMMYRLTDPANGRTVVYLRSDDPKLGQMMGEFIGVKGEVINDAERNLKVINTTAFEAVNPGKFGQSVVAQFAPPSLLPNVASGRDGN